MVPVLPSRAEEYEDGDNTLHHSVYEQYGSVSHTALSPHRPKQKGRLSLSLPRSISYDSQRRYSSGQELENPLIQNFATQKSPSKENLGTQKSPIRQGANLKEAYNKISDN